MIRTLRLLLWGLSVVTLGGCVETIVLGTATSAVMLSQQDKELRDMDPNGIAVRLEKAIESQKILTARDDIKIIVDGNKVVFIGYVSSASKLETLIDTAYQLGDVASIHSEMLVYPPRDRSNRLSDNSIMTSLKTRVALNSKVKGDHFRFYAFDGVLYIFGAAKSQEELDEAQLLAASTAGVRKTVSYAVLAAYSGKE